MGKLKLFSKLFKFGATSAMISAGALSVYSNVQVAKAKSSASTSEFNYIYDATFPGTTADSNWVPRSDFESPDYMYTIRPISDLPGGDWNHPNTNWATTPTSILSHMAEMGIVGPGLEDTLVDKLSPITLWSYFPSPTPSMIAAAQDAYNSFFGSQAEIKKYYDELNQFSSTVDITQPLTIKEPTAVKDIFTYDTATPNSGNDVSIPSDFAYKVASIGVENIQDVDNYVFDIDYANDLDDDNYSLVLSTRENLIKDTLLATADPSKAIEELQRSMTIYIRDQKSTYDYFSNSLAPEGADLPIETYSDRVYLSYDMTSKELGIYIKPDGDEVTFGVSNVMGAEAEKNLKYGFLDNSLSPLYMDNESGWTGGSSSWNPSAPVNSSILGASKGDYYIQNDAASWSINGGFDYPGTGLQAETEFIRFYMPNGTSFQTEIYYNNNAAQLEGNNTLEIKFENGAYEVSPTDRFEIEAASHNPDIPGIYVNAQIINDNSPAYTEMADKQWLQVDIGVPNNGRVAFADLWQSNATQTNFGLSSADESIYFNLPSGLGGVTDLTDQKVIGIDPITDTSAKYDDILQNVLFNWSSFATSTDGNRYIAPDETLVDDPESSFGFGTYDAYFVRYMDSPIDGSIVEAPGITGRGNQKLPVYDGGNVLETEWLPTTGINIYNSLNDYWNYLYDVLVNKLNQNPSEINPKDFYKNLDTANLSTEWKRKITDGSAEGQELIDVTTAIARWWTGDTLSTDEQKVINDLKTPDSDYYELVNANHTNGMTTNIDFIKDKGNIADTSSVQEKAEAYQYIYHVVQPFFAKAVDAKFGIANVLFNNLKGSVLGIHMSSFLTTFSASNLAINVDPTTGTGALKVLDNSNLSENVRDLHLVSIGGDKSKSAESGADVLQSIIDFIYTFQIHPGIDGAVLEEFNVNYQLGNFTNENIYSDRNNLPVVRTMIYVLDELMQPFVAVNRTLLEIVDDIIALKENDPTTAIRSAFMEMVEGILSDEQEMEYNVFSKTYTSDKITNLVIGNNLGQVVRKYIEISEASGSWEEKESAVQEKIKNVAEGGSYDEETITQVAVNMGYYNVDFFINRLSSEETIPEMVEEILTSDLDRNLVFQLPESNAFVDFIAESNMFYTYTSMGGGGLLVLVSLVLLTTSFRESAKVNNKKIKNAIFRLVFLTGILAGAGIAVVPFIL